MRNSELHGPLGQGTFREDRQWWVYGAGAPTVKNAFPLRPVPQPPSTRWRQLMLTNFLCISSDEFYTAMHIYHATPFFFCPQLGSRYPTLCFFNTLSGKFSYTHAYRDNSFVLGAV